MSEKRARRARKAARLAARNFYADTSTLRKAGNALAEVTSHGPTRTSMLTVVELLNGIRHSDNEFFRRRGALRNARKAHLAIDWRPVEVMMLATFDRTTDRADRWFAEDDIERPLSSITDLALSSTNLASFQEGLVAAKLHEPLARFEEWDNAITKTFVTKTIEGNAETKRIADEIRQGKRPPPPRGAHWSLKEFSDHILEDTGLNRSITIYALARFVSRLLEGSPAPALIHDSYNGRADAFVEAFSVASIKATGLMNSPGRNDGMDFMHFLYLDPSTTLLSEDDKQRQYALDVGMRARSLEDCLKRLRDEKARGRR